MRVLFDHQTFTYQEFGGISRYFFEINKHFRGMPGVESRCSVLFSNNEYIRDKQLFSPIPFFAGKKFKGKLRMMSAINTFRSKVAYKQGGFDIFHPTYYDTYYVGLRRKAPIVVTCLDLIHEKFITDDVRTLQNKKTTLTNADCVVAISHNTKKDLVEYYNISPSKIAVTHLASSFPIVDATSIPANQGERFLLYVGMRNLYKNFAGFVRAIAPLIAADKDLYLYFAGAGSFTNEEKAFLAEMKVLDKVKYFPGSDSSLRDLYSRALAFFYPSLYEGFGIPVLEAMACGCPVAASDRSSLPEVGGNAAIYFDPERPESILDVASQLVKSESLRISLRDKGLARAREFSWEKTARETVDVYKSLL